MNSAKHMQYHAITDPLPHQSVQVNTRARLNTFERFERWSGVSTQFPYAFLRGCEDKCSECSRVFKAPNVVLLPVLVFRRPVNRPGIADHCTIGENDRVSGA